MPNRVFQTPTDQTLATPPHVPFLLPHAHKTLESKVLVLPESCLSACLSHGSPSALGDRSLIPFQGSAALRLLLALLLALGRSSQLADDLLNAHHVALVIALEEVVRKVHCTEDGQDLGVRCAEAARHLKSRLQKQKIAVSDPLPQRKCQR